MNEIENPSSSIRGSVDLIARALRFLGAMTAGVEWMLLELRPCLTRVISVETDPVLIAAES